MSLWKQILLGMVAGAIVGALLKGMDISFIQFSYFKQVGDIFIRMIKMLIAPIIFFSILTGVTNLGLDKSLGRVGIKSLLLYLMSTLLAAVVGVAVAMSFESGNQQGLEVCSKEELATLPLLDGLLSLIPQPFSDVNPLQIIILAASFGVGLGLSNHPKKNLVISFNEVCAETLYKLIEAIMKGAPYAVFCIMLFVAGTQGLVVLGGIGKLFLVFILGCVLHVVMVYFTAIRFYVGISFTSYLKAMKSAFLVAFTTSSSSATMPTTLRCIKEKLGVSSNTANFIIPIGTTINMDGMVISHCVCAVFGAQYFGIDLTISQLFMVVLTVTLASVGAAGVPGAAVIMLGMVFDTIGISSENQITLIGVLIGVDWVIGMVRTVVNVAGDTVVAAVVDKSEGAFTPHPVHA